MRRGTTPIHEFEIPFEKAEIKSARVIYSQNDNIVLCKETKDCEIADGLITVRLSQEETLTFNCGLLVNIQIKILTHADEVLLSDVIRKGVDECLDNEVIT